MKQVKRKTINLCNYLQYYKKVQYHRIILNKIRINQIKSILLYKIASFSKKIATYLHYTNKVKVLKSKVLVAIKIKNQIIHRKIFNL